MKATRETTAKSSKANYLVTRKNSINYTYLVHLYIVPVEVHCGHPIFHVRFPPHALRSQVVQLHVTIVVAGG